MSTEMVGVSTAVGVVVVVGNMFCNEARDKMEGLLFVALELFTSFCFVLLLFPLLLLLLLDFPVMLKADFDLGLLLLTGGEVVVFVVVVVAVVVVVVVEFGVAVATCSVGTAVVLLSDLFLENYNYKVSIFYNEIII